MAKTNAPKTSTSMNIITLKVTLRGTKPPVWRRLVMPGTMTLGDLHRAIQAAMGWHDGHLHAFDIGGEQYGDRHSVDDVADENRVTLNGLLRSPVVRFTYTYDFGDNWQHTVAFEKSEPAVEGVSYPVCITGNCPPEDCGGVRGYEELLAIRGYTAEDYAVINRALRAENAEAEIARLQPYIDTNLTGHAA